MIVRRTKFRDCSAGFSLLELLVVMAIVSAALVLAVPRFSKTASAPSLRATAFALAASARAARAQAIASNQDVAFVLDFQSKSYGSSSGSLVALPPGISLSVESAKEMVREAQGASVIFYPSGGSTGGRIILFSSLVRATVAVDWLTGAVTVMQDPI
jgi:general secretion pathway protein H